MSLNAPGVHIDDFTASKNAVSNALNKIIGRFDKKSGKYSAGELIDQIVAKFINATTEREIDLTVTGLSVAELDRFRNQLKERIRKVRSVEVRGQYKKAARLGIYYSGKTEDFTYELTKKAEKLGFKIEVVERYPNSASIKAVLIK